MASINDVFNAVNKVNTTLWQEIAATKDVKTSVDAVDTDVKNVKASVDTLDTDLKSGFTATVNELKTIAQIDTVIAEILYHLTQQADTMICALQQISQNTCGILTQVTYQTPLQEKLVEDSDAIRRIEDFAHPDAALESHRLAELRKKIEVCCPPAKPNPACSYQPCPAPKPISTPRLPKVGDSQNVKQVG